jgi:hypothetical protein
MSVKKFLRRRTETIIEKISDGDVVPEPGQVYCWKLQKILGQSTSFSGTRIETWPVSCFVCGGAIAGKKDFYARTGLSY